jgi:hypothetical protein
MMDKRLSKPKAKEAIQIEDGRFFRNSSPEM